MFCARGAISELNPNVAAVHQIADAVGIDDILMLSMVIFLCRF